MKKTMGTVHGVYLKYVGFSALSYAGLRCLSKDNEGSSLTILELLGYSAKSMLSVLTLHGGSMGDSLGGSTVSLWRAVPSLVLGYSVLVNGVIALLFKMEFGMGIIGKNRKTGKIPNWSYFVFFPFHLPTQLYTALHLRKDKKLVEKNGVVVHKCPVATEVQPGWWVGGCHGHELDKEWAGVIDLTVEFPETTIKRTRAYLSMPTWDGVPATPEQLEEAANFAVRAKEDGNGDILVHCAHGRGRSTTVMCACLVKAGLFETWKEAFEKGIQPQRSVCKLNRRMKQNLAAWQERFIDGKKGQ